MAEKRVLIVDDDDTIRRLLTVICQKYGYPYDEAKDGSEALQLLREKEYGVVLLDLNMPKVDGSEVLRQLQATQPRTLKTIIVVSAVAQAKALEPMPAEVCQFVVKPFNVPDLVERIRRCLEDPGDAVGTEPAANEVAGDPG